ncbi:phosphatase PAP2 family protein [Roseibium aggregatum]|uniref:phosphatase PAP2 family protein n=1 Tax=Roseibium aggregatum TaxID=187304 RepID=UPI00094B5383|nr:phosphatase PAP2 family protein [Roseibium aggregatum]UFI06852.1 phosphatase PAP2 family protein [Roseibium aggregatum]
MYLLDAFFTHLVNAFSGSSFLADNLMIWISAAGVPVIVLTVAGQWWRRTDRYHVRHVLVASGLSFMLGLAINQLILLDFARVRPYDANVTHLLISPSADPSFPSDHATATFALASIFLLYGLRRLGSLYLAAAFLVAISRVYVGTHYISDVIGGAATGLSAALTVRFFYREGTRIDRLITRIF